MNEFFVDTKLETFEVNGKQFKYKPADGGDELDWYPDYAEQITEVVDGEEVITRKINIGKFGLCKLRNIMEVPFSQDELKKITGLDKPYSQYTMNDKDMLFRKLKGSILTDIIKKIDDVNSHKKKDS